MTAMIVRVRGVKKVRSKGKIYYYHRATGTRLLAPPGTVEFLIEIGRLNTSAGIDEKTEFVKRRYAGRTSALIRSPTNRARTNMPSERRVRGRRREKGNGMSHGIPTMSELVWHLRDLSMDPVKIYATVKTDRFVTTFNWHLLTEAEVKEWNEAVAEGIRLGEAEINRRLDQMFPRLN
jgi:hypothetical protein